MGRYIAQFHVSFIPPVLPGVSFSHLLGPFYEVTTSSPDLVLTIPELLLLSRQPEYQLLTRWNAGFVQDNSATVTMTENGFQAERRLAARGLTGAGTVLAVLDSGVDLSHPLFSDPSSPTFSYNALNPSHRKVLFYRTWADGMELPSSHGTFTAAIAVGESNCGGNELSMYDGVAPGAKLHLVDIRWNNTESLSSPPPTILAREMDRTGAVICSNSWGVEGYHELTSYLWELFAMTVPDKLVVFASGNSGANGPATVYSPAGSKNILTVGALDMRTDSFFENILGFQIRTESGTHDVTSSSAGLDLFLFPRLLCDVPTSTVPDPNKVLVLTQQGNLCFLPINPLAVLATFEPSACAAPLPFPVIVGPSNVASAQWVTAELVNIVVPQLPAVATYSSTGPSISNIVKPDLVAPGTRIVSARWGSDNCAGSDALLSASGTSCARPFIAGAALLVQQYFQDFHAITPSGNLLRAVLVASADPLPDMPRHPSTKSGHGMVNLANVLPVDATIRFVDSVFVGQSEDWKWTIRVTGQGKGLRIAMAYLNLPGTPCGLFIDLDLYVVLPNSTIVYGNMRPNAREERFSTVERVVLTAAECSAGDYGVHVASHGDFERVPNRKIDLSLFVAGTIDMGVLFVGVPGPLAECVGTIGTHCQTVPLELRNESQSVEVLGNSLEYFRMRVPKEDFGKMLLSFIRKSESMVNFIYLWAFYRMPLMPADSDTKWESTDSRFQLLAGKDVLGDGNASAIAVLNVGPDSITVEFYYELDPLPAAKPTPSAGLFCFTEILKSYYAPMVIGFSLVGVLTLVTVVLSVCLWLAKKRDANQETIMVP
jgi:subtilisin family serine protease